MSFILDALRKSEHERQRQTGPALVESATVAPKPRTNRWATAAIVLLVVNLIALGIVLLTKSREVPTSASAPSSVTPTTEAPSSSPATGTARPTAAAPAASGSATGPQAQATVAATPPMMRPAAPPPVRTGRNPLQEEIAVDSATLADDVAMGAAAPPPGPPAVRSAAPVRPGTVVYQSLPEADPVTSEAATSAAEGSGRTAGLPRADEVTARTGSPELRLELHVYSTRPAERMVFINSHQYREGDTTQEGARIDEITPNGVIMNMNGNRFLLPRD